MLTTLKMLLKMLTTLNQWLLVEDDLFITRDGTMAQWQNGTMAQWHNGSTAVWHNGRMAVKQYGTITERQNMEQQVEEWMAQLSFEIFSYEPCQWCKIDSSL